MIKGKEGVAGSIPVSNDERINRGCGQHPGIK